MLEAENAIDREARTKLSIVCELKLDVCKGVSDFGIIRGCLQSFNFNIWYF